MLFSDRNEENKDKLKSKDHFKNEKKIMQKLVDQLERPLFGRHRSRVSPRPSNWICRWRRVTVPSLFHMKLLWLFFPIEEKSKTSMLKTRPSFGIYFFSSHPLSRRRSGHQFVWSIRLMLWQMHVWTDLKERTIPFIETFSQKSEFRYDDRPHPSSRARTFQRYWLSPS